MDTATASVIATSMTTLVWASRPAIYLAVAHATRRDPITRFSCDTDGLRIKVRVTYQPRTAVASRPLDSASPGTTPRLTVLPSERLAAHSPHKP
ncbi:MAG TPA: hypothetical protein VE972_05570 [Conexibacter sp.]|nr:hypothetical protein [Conexibacter sp.]